MVTIRSYEHDNNINGGKYLGIFSDLQRVTYSEWWKLNGMRRKVQTEDQKYKTKIKAQWADNDKLDGRNREIKGNGRKGKQWPEIWCWTITSPIILRSKPAEDRKKLVCPKN